MRDQFKMVVENSGKSARSVPSKGNDGAYIKNLQHQIYLLELELDGGKPAKAGAVAIKNVDVQKPVEADREVLNQTIEFLESKIKTITTAHSAKSNVWMQEKQQMVGDLLKLKQHSEGSRKDFEKQLALLRQQEKLSNARTQEITTLNAQMEMLKETSLHQEVLIKAQQGKIGVLLGSVQTACKVEEASDLQLVAKLKAQVIALGSKLEQVEASKKHEVFLREHVVADLNEALIKITTMQHALIESSNNNHKAEQLSETLVRAQQECAELRVKAALDQDLLSEKSLLVTEMDKSIANQFKKMAEFEHNHIQSKVVHDSTLQQNTDLESDLLASTSAASLLELEKRQDISHHTNHRMLIDEIAELQNGMEAAKREIDMNAMDKRVEAAKCGKLEEKCRILMCVIGRMDDLQKSSQQQETILMEMRGQLVSL